MNDEMAIYWLDLLLYSIPLTTVEDRNYHDAVMRAIYVLKERLYKNDNTRKENT